MTKTDNHLLAKVGQYALIKNDEGHVLVLERARSKTWSLPGGRLEKGEALDKALIREIKEETDLDVVKIKPFATNILTDPYQTKYCVYFETKVMNPSIIKISPEHTQYKWISLEDIPKIKGEDELVVKVISEYLQLLLHKD